MCNNKKIFQKIFSPNFGKSQSLVFLRIRGDVTPTYTIISTEGSEAISNSIRTPREVCNAFNRFCRKTIKREATTPIVMQSADVFVKFLSQISLI